MNDFMDILKAANKLDKSRAGEDSNYDIKIAVLGTVSLQFFVKVLRYQLKLDNISAKIYEGEYNGIAMDAFNLDSPLYRFEPDIVIILCHYMDIKEYPNMLEMDTDVDKLALEKVSFYETVWSKISSIKGCKILQSNYAIPAEYLLGNLERKASYSETSFIEKINRLLEERKHDNVIIVDSELLAANIGKQRWFDYSAYFVSKSGCRLDYLPDYSKIFESIILNLKGKVRKCLVLDLDNTLWGGVVGDVGYDGVQVDPNDAVGETFRYFQFYLKKLRKRGVILAVCSKNDEAVAKEVFEKNKNMILGLDDFACFIANWDDKATNIRRIADSLNIGVDSIVFFDDNPAEREIVSKYLPEVHVVNVPDDSADYVRSLAEDRPFDWINITKEDLIRTDSYIQNANRVRLQESFVDYNEYLMALEMKGTAGLLKEPDVERFTQLINKSNQFNLRTQRYADSDILSFTRNREYRCIYVKLQDKFSDYGIISCIIMRISGKIAFIDSWVMSCRVLKRGVEQFAFDEIIKQCVEAGCDEITAEYIPSKKNAMVNSFYESLGFTVTEESSEIKKYKLNIKENVVSEKYFIERMETE